MSEKHTGRHAHLKRVARSGAVARMNLHGNPGTSEGRRLGGLNSVKIQKDASTGFKQLHNFSIPRRSTCLAEAFGILAGDGHIGKYQLSVSTNATTDSEHAMYVKELFEKLLKLPVSIQHRRTRNTCVVVVSSKRACSYFAKNGLIQGNKIVGGLDMPLWIEKQKQYRHSFIRGIFDTDGCVYVDTHKTSGRIYRNLGMAFANHSLPLLARFRNELNSIGLHPTQTTKYTVFLRREQEIIRYFEIIGSSNPKHLKKIDDFLASKQRRSARNW